MGENLPHQIADRANLILESLVRPIRSNETASPALLDCIKQVGSICVLADREARSNLPAKLVPSAGLKRDAEAAFPVYESGNVGCEIHGKDQGRRVMEPYSPIQGSHP